MRLFLLTALTMVAFAANSVLNRMALAGGLIEPATFGLVRLVAGAAVLVALSLVLGRGLPVRAPRRAVAVLALLTYIFGFSAAYTRLDSGLGALILFGVVQITMFTGALMGGEAISARRGGGAALAFAGLVWLVWPGGATSLPPLQAFLMALAGVGWGLYSLAGRGAGDPLAATAANFLLAALLAVLAGATLGGWEPLAAAEPAGIWLAVLSGAVTSGLGYALWYSVLPRLAAASAAVAQLTVPVIAMAGGMVFLSEALSLGFVLGAALVLGGVAVSVMRARRD